MNHGLKSRTIKAVLRKKIDAWLATITDEKLREACAREVIVTGGSIASMLLGEKVNDFDVYFKTQKTVKAVAEYYVAQFKREKKAQKGVEVPIYVEELKDSRGRDRVRIVVKSAGVASTEATQDYQYFESRPDHEAGEYVDEAFDPLEDNNEQAEAAGPGPDYAPVFLSTNAISLRGKIQLVLRFFGEPDEIHENYDFAHCTSYWAGGDNKLVLRPEALEALLSRTLVYRGSLYPLSSVIRTRKFIERGWRINAGQYLKMILQLQDLDLRDFTILEEQLTGVDVAYFAQMLVQLKQKNPERVDTAYITEIIDRMF